MTMVPPNNVPVGTNRGFLTGFPEPIGNFPQVQPFSYVDGLTFQKLFEAYRVWLRTVLVPGVANAIDENTDAYNKATDALRASMIEYLREIAEDRAAFEALVDQKTAEINAAIEANRQAMAQALADGKAQIDKGVADAVAAKLAAEAARDAAQQWAANTQKLQDTAVSTLLGDASSLSAKAAVVIADARIKAAPASGFSAAVQAIFEKANSAYILQPTGIPETDLNAKTRSRLEKLGSMVDAMDLTGVDTWGLGHSWVAIAPGGIEPYVPRVFRNLKAASYTNIATSGYRMQDVCIEAYSGYTYPAKIVPQYVKGVFLLDGLLNHLGDVDNAGNRRGALEATRSVVALLRSTQRIEQDNTEYFTNGPTIQAAYTNQWRKWASGASATGTPTSNAGDIIDMNLKVGVDYYPMVIGFAASSAEPTGATIDINENEAGGTQNQTFNTGSVFNNTPFHGDGSMTMVGSKITGKPNRLNRFRFKKSATVTGTWMYVDGVLPQHKPNTGPIVVLVKPVAVTNPAYQKPDLLNYLRTVPDTVAAEFGPRVIVVDPQPGWNKDTMLQDDQTHPNELGNTYLANLVQTAIKAKLSEQLSSTLNSAIGLVQ